MNKFWSFGQDENGERVLRLEGPIDSDLLWYDDAVTPKEFREELEKDTGDITVWINSPGGNVFAAAEIYTMLCDYKGKVTVKIDALAASAASVVAMAGDKVLISPVAMLMIHDPSTMAWGNIQDFEKCIGSLKEIKESIINAYVKKTGLKREEISELMTNETWLSAKKALDYGFVDEILFSNTKGDEGNEPKAKNKFEASWEVFSAKSMGQNVAKRLLCPSGNTPVEPEKLPEGARKNNLLNMNGKTSDGAMPYELLIRQLEFLR